jgi:hypothetical protein
MSRNSVTELHNFYAASAPGQNFDKAPAAPTSTFIISSQLIEKKPKVT